MDAIAPRVVLVAGILLCLLAGIAVAASRPIARALIRLKTRRLPSGLSDRLREEWLAEADAATTPIGRLIFVAGLLFASGKALVEAVESDHGLAIATDMPLPRPDAVALSDRPERVIAYLLDVVASVILAIPADLVIPRNYLPDAMMMRLVYQMLVYWFAYVFCATRFGGSPGKLMMKLRIVPLDGGKLTVAQAIVRMAPWYFPALATGVMTLALSFSHAETLRGLAPVAQSRYLASLIPGWYSGMVSVFLCVWGLAELTVFIQWNGRSLRDMVAGTVVILKTPASVEVPTLPPVAKSTSMFR